MRSDPLGVIRRSDFYLRTHRVICLPGSAFDRLPTLSRLCEPDQLFGWDGADLVQTREFESTNE